MKNILIILFYILINSYCIQNFGIEDYRSTIINTIFSISLIILTIILKRTKYYGLTKVTNLKDAISYLKENDIWVFAAEAGGKIIYNQNLNLPLAIVIGSEGFGVKKTVISSCDGVISLPLMGKVNSLNASVACGTIVFEALRQRIK